MNIIDGIKQFLNIKKFFPKFMTWCFVCGICLKMKNAPTVIDNMQICKYAKLMVKSGKFPMFCELDHEDCNTCIKWYELLECTDMEDALEICKAVNNSSNWDLLKTLAID